MSLLLFLDFEKIGPLLDGGAVSIFPEEGFRSEGLTVGDSGAGFTLGGSVPEGAGLVVGESSCLSSFLLVLGLEGLIDKVGCGDRVGSISLSNSIPGDFDGEIEILGIKVGSVIGFIISLGVDVGSEVGKSVS